MTATHQQDSGDQTPERRELVKRAADLCRARPAEYAAVVRYADQMRALGTEHDEALRVALDRYDELTAGL